MLNSKFKILFLFFFHCLSFSLMAQVNQILGDWKTVDDKTGNNYAVVRIYKAADGLYYGKIVRLLVQGADDWLCAECTGNDHNKPILGLVILRGLREDKGELVDGRCLDPQTGKFYYGKVFLKDGQLVLRGSLDKRGIFGRNQTWIR